MVAAWAGCILNQDGTLNSPGNPAAQGAPIICATGVGAMTLAGGNAVTTSPVKVFIAGINPKGIAAILGPVAGLPGNVHQISAFVPQLSNYTAPLPVEVAQPLVPVLLEVNGTWSQNWLASSAGK